MADREILQFAGGVGANVISQVDYALLTALLDEGFSSGVADSAKLNKVWRQSNFMAVGLAEWLVTKGIDVPDDGDVDALAANIDAAVKSCIDNAIGGPVFLSSGTTTIADGLTRYVGANHIVSAAEADVTFILPFKGIITNLWGYVPAATAGTRAYTLRKNAIDTALTCSASGVTTTASDTTNLVSFVAGDQFDIKVVTSGGSDVQIHKASLMVYKVL